MRLVRPVLALLLTASSLSVRAAPGAPPGAPELERIPAGKAGAEPSPTTLVHHVGPPEDPNADLDGRTPPSPADARHPPGAKRPRPGELQPAGAEGDAEDEAPQPVAWTIEDRRAAHRTHLLTVGVGAWPTALDAQLWYAVPLLRRGFLPRVNDAFHLEFGSLLTWDHDGTVALWPAAGVRWDFYLTRRWATFFGLKLAAEIHLNRDQRVHPNAIVGFGALFRLAERALLRLELGYPQGLSVGLSFPIGPV